MKITLKTKGHVTITLLLLAFTITHIHTSTSHEYPGMCFSFSAEREKRTDRLTSSRWAVRAQLAAQLYKYIYDVRLPTGWPKKLAPLF